MLFDALIAVGFFGGALSIGLLISALFSERDGDECIVWRSWDEEK